MTIAGSRLDLGMGFLWHHLDRAVDVERARRTPGAKLCDQVRRLAHERLQGSMRDDAIAAVERAEAVRAERNAIVHQDWVLRSGDAMRSVTELDQVTPEEWPEYLEQWERESKESPDWQRVPSRACDVVPAQTLDELRKVERACRRNCCSHQTDGPSSEFP